jgi:hypothetical protein
MSRGRVGGLVEENSKGITEGEKYGEREKESNKGEG